MRPDAYDNDAFPSGGSQVNPRNPIVREHSTYMTDREAEALCQLFADGLSSGIGYARILDFMERRGLDKKMIARLRYAILERGDQLGEAFARIGLLDPPARKLILVAEAQGGLPETFRMQARVYEQRYKRKLKVVYGLVEVAILTCLGAIVFPQVFINGLSAPGEQVWAVITRTLTIAFIQSGLFLSVAGLLAYGWLNLPVEFGPRRISRNIWFRIPVFSEPARLYSVANFCRYMRQSIASGMDIFRSLELAAEASDSPFIMRRSAGALDALEQGMSLDRAMATIKDLPDEVVEHVAIGEETGNLEERLAFLTERYDELSMESFARSISVGVYLVRALVIVVIIGSALWVVSTSLEMPL